MTAKQKILKVLRESKPRDPTERQRLLQRLREAAARLAKSPPSPGK